MKPCYCRFSRRLSAVLLGAVLSSLPALAQQGGDTTRPAYDGSGAVLPGLLEQAIGQQPLLRERQAMTLSLAELRRRALKDNHGLQRGLRQDRIAAANALIAEAGLDPVLTLSADYQYSKRETRIESARRYRSATEVDDQGRNVIAVDEAFDPRAPVVVYSEAREAGLDEEATDILASQESLTGGDETLSFGAGFGKVLSWGGRFDITFEAINRDTYFINNPSLYFGSVSPPLNLIGYGSYERPWVSSLIADVEMPLPGTAGFGRASPAALSRTLAGAQRQAAAAVFDALKADTLLQAEALYWQLLDRALGLEAALQNERAAQALLDSTNRLYDSRSANNFDQSQARLARADAAQQLQQQWSAYLSASDSLAAFLNLPDDAALIPVGFESALRAPVKAQTAGLDGQHPDLRAAQAARDASLASQLAASDNLAPALSANAGIELRQSNALYGYESFGDSASSVFDPDIRTLRVGVSFSRPLGNRVNKAALAAADAQLRASEFQLQAVRGQLEAGVPAAQARLEAAVLSLGYMDEALRYAEEVWGKARLQQRSRQIREFELATQLSNLLSARLAHLQAMTNVRQAETALLLAQGRLHSRVSAEAMQ
ncbi:TolC family protein [Granulosicoccaceae sp. 1_MG-2023]|nr:TolC family protein [Granulosicoccaceae sp. 1_MG-2023]